MVEKCMQSTHFPELFTTNMFLGYFGRFWRKLRILKVSPKIGQHMEYANISHEVHNIQHGKINWNSAKYSALRPRVCRMRHKCLCCRGTRIESVDCLVWIKSQPLNSNLLEGRISRCGRLCYTLKSIFTTLFWEESMFRFSKYGMGP